MSHPLTNKLIFETNAETYRVLNDKVIIDYLRECARSLANRISYWGVGQIKPILGLSPEGEKEIKCARHGNMHPCPSCDPTYNPEKPKETPIKCCHFDSDAGTSYGIIVLSAGLG